ncbi:uncharacterized protein LOC132750739 isoform X2 [Ruditapes philippinarum]|uniref:uncharacterized protein LOC132750739 isoform X2 n=1 Tax=Ruditapes philippinarum TaxID=129788 RepID=UPI00295C1A46|nr:uncharacterized protein LOC132750739 isoform X2 [Ruditapes philippinarum]
MPPKHLCYVPTIVRAIVCLSISNPHYMATRKKADGYRCIHISEKRLFQCKFCLRIVSTKDNILKHLCSQHGLSPFKGVIRSITGEKQSNQRKTKVTLVAQNCDIFGSVQTFRGQPSGDILHALGVESSRSLRRVQRICVNGNKFYSAEYSRMKKRTCLAVLYSTDKLGLVHYLF